MNRRTFSVSAGCAGLVAACSVHQAFAQAAPAPDIAVIDRGRILRQAAEYLKEKPVTITASSSPRSAGGMHDYFSEADYFWSDPAHPDGPYINRDGQSNPDNFNQHRLALIRLSLQMPALTAAWVLTRDRRYASKAADHLRAWFVTPATRMNPNLEYAQAVHGRSTGRNYGIIDTLHLVEVSRAAQLLIAGKELSAQDASGVRAWFAEYLHWLTTSERGAQERDTKNNHSTTWMMQAAQFAAMTGAEDVLEDCRRRFKNVILPGQVAPDGSLPLELARTKPYSYSLFDIDALAMCCQILSTADDNLWHYQTADGRSVGKAIAFMVPYIQDKARWPYAKDVEHFDQFPVRQPSLLFGGIALDKPGWIALWKTLDPDPVSPEVIRNFPIRQPLLWVN